jgi:predicted MPP superfamily phosphohydrolase
MMQLIFFAASALVLLFGHFLLWQFFIKFFQLHSYPGSLYLAIIILILFLSVILASYLIHKRDNLFTRWYYIITASWVGLLANFFIAIVFTYFLKYFLPLLNINPANSFYQLVLFAIAIALSIYGIYSAHYPQITEYSVFVKDLSAAWDNKTIVQISDVHLGPVYRQFFFNRIMDQIAVINPEAVFITGDLFDGMEADFSWFGKPFNKINPPAGIYYSFGNHDLYLGFNRVMEILKNSPLIILDNKMKEVAGLQIIGINYSFEKDFDLEKNILDQVGYNKNKPSLLLFHAPKNIDLARSAGIDLQLSGHTHDGQMFPFNFLAKWTHKGYGYGLFKLADFSLIVSRGVGTWGPPMRTSGSSEIVKIILKKK